MEKKTAIEKDKKSERRLFLAGTTLIILGALLAVLDLNIHTGTLIRLDILPLGIGLLGLSCIIIGAVSVFSWANVTVTSFYLTFVVTDLSCFYLLQPLLYRRGKSTRLR